MKNKSRILLAIISLLVVRSTSAQTVLQVLNPLGAQSSQIAAIGDINGDGASDVAVSVSILGTIGIFSGIDGTPLTTWNAPHVLFDGFLANAGDTDGDGTDDLIVSEGAASLNYAWATVSVHSGANGNQLLLIPQFQAFCGFGFRTALIGDLNNDGFNDIAISAPTASTGNLTMNGSLRIHSGQNGALLFSVDGSGNNEHLGAGVISMGDVNGDGTPDFAASSLAAGGSAHVFSGLNGTILLSYSMGGNSLSGISTLLQGGFELSGGVDLDSDGTNDLILGKTSHNGGDGAIHVVSGQTGLLVRTLNGEPNSGFGDNLSVGDINSDSFADIVAREATTNRVLVFSGSSGAAVWDTTLLANDIEQAQLVGDTNLDGDRDVVLRISPNAPQNAGALVVVSGGPWLGNAAQSKIGAALGNIEDLLLVNGTTGGSTRRIDLDGGETFSISLSQPSTNANPANFAIFGRVDVPQDTESYPLFNMGNICLVPRPLVLAFPELFTLTSTSPMPGGEILPASFAPWAYSVSGGLSFPLSFTLQAVVAETAMSTKVANAILVRVR